MKEYTVTAEVIAEKQQPLVCEDCLCKNKRVKERVCPYAEEINQTIVEIVVCDDCYHERVKAIEKLQRERDELKARLTRLEKNPCLTCDGHGAVGDILNVDDIHDVTLCAVLAHRGDSDG